MEYSSHWMEQKVLRETYSIESWFWEKSRIQEKQGKEERKSDSSSITVVTTSRVFTYNRMQFQRWYDMGLIWFFPKNQWNEGVILLNKSFSWNFLLKQSYMPWWINYTCPVKCFQHEYKWNKGGYMVINYIQLCLLCSYITFIICLNYNFHLFTAIIKCCRRSFRKSVSPENNFLGRNYLRYFWELWREESGAFDDFLIKSTGKSICLHNLIVKVFMTNMTIRNQSID